MTNAEARFNKIHIRKVYACLAVTCHLHFWQNDRDFLRATVVTRGGTDTEIRVSTESRPWRRKFSRRSSRDSNPRPFNHESGALTTELSPPPVQNVRCKLAYSYFLLTVMSLAAITEERVSFPEQDLRFTISPAARNVVMLNVPGV